MSNLDLKNIIEHGNLDLGDARKLYEMIERESVLSKYNFPDKPSSDGYYHIWVTDSRKSNGRRQLKARNLEELKDKVYNHSKGIDSSSRKTFKQVFELVQKEKVKYIKNPDKLISVQNTVGRNITEYKRFFSGTRFENMFVDKISKKDIENICITNIERYSLREKAIKSMRGILKSVFDLAFGEYWITDNVYDRVDFSKYKNYTAPSTPISNRLHSPEQLDRIISFIHNHQAKKPKYVASYALEMQILCGLRRGEVPPLMWTDVHDTFIAIRREQITVKRNGGNIAEHFQIVDHTKTYRDRKFPITEDVKDLLLRLRAVHDRYYPDSKYLFPADSTTGVITNNTVYEFYRRMCKKLGIAICRDEMKGPHSFRRNAITKVTNSKDGNIVLASILYGNSPAVAVKNYYAGVDIELAKNIIEEG